MFLNLFPWWESNSTTQEINEADDMEVNKEDQNERVRRRTSWIDCKILVDEEDQIEWVIMARVKKKDRAGLQPPPPPLPKFLLFHMQCDNFHIM